MTHVEKAMQGVLSPFGGYLRCETCRRRRPLGDPGRRVTSTGWPKCCGYTMRWWTQRQVDAGEDYARHALEDLAVNTPNDAVLTPTPSPMTYERTEQ